MTTNKNWLRLDNSAKVYPLIMYKDNQNLFRLSAELNEDIDKTVMQKAIDMTLPRFPSIQVRLMKGIFWYYFEHNSNRATLREESDIIMDKITPNNCDEFCFRISYYRNRLTIEFFHVLADGTGGLAFLKSILYTYLTLQNHTINTEGKVLTYDSPIDEKELEDSFNKYYIPVKLKNTNFSALTGSKNAFSIKGEPFPTKGKRVIGADTSAKVLHAFCKSKGCTITEYLGGLFMYSVYMTKGKNTTNPDDLVLLIPMNLRKIYESVTLRNFTMMSRVPMNIQRQDITLDEFINAVKDGLKAGLDRKSIDNQISMAVFAEKVPIMRIAPIGIKKLAFNISNIQGRKKIKKTASFSNIGIVDLPEDMRPFVKKFDFLLHSYSVAPKALTVITVWDTLSINITSSIQDTEIERFFFTYLANNGLDLTVNSNYWEVDNAL